MVELLYYGICAMGNSLTVLSVHWVVRVASPCNLSCWGQLPYHAILAVGDGIAMPCYLCRSEQYWKNMAEDLEAYATHAHRHTINEADMELLMRR